MYKEGRGVPKDSSEAVRLMGQASIAGNLDAMVEYAIAQFNGTGVAKDEPAAAKLFLIAARRGSAIAQNRLARMLMAGRGMPADPTEAIKWHLIAKAGGDSDPDLDAFAAKQTPAVRDAAEKAARNGCRPLATARLDAFLHPSPARGGIGRLRPPYLRQERRFGASAMERSERGGAPSQIC